MTYTPEVLITDFILLVFYADWFSESAAVAALLALPPTTGLQDMGFSIRTPGKQGSTLAADRNRPVLQLELADECSD
jgi:hypothetical protein